MTVIYVKRFGFERTDMARNYYYKREIIEILQCDEEFLEELESEDLVRSVDEDSIDEQVFPPDQVERIRIIRTLMRDLEVNLAGVEVILEMRENMIRMQQQFHQILETLVDELKTRMPH